MAFVIGTDTFGRIERDDGTADATEFLHGSWLPVVPLAGRRIVGGRAQPAPFRAASIALAYLRGWGWFAALAMGIWGICAPVDHISVPLCVGIALVAVLTLEAWIGSLWFGRRRVNRPLAALTLTAPALGLAAGLWVALDDHPDIMQRHCDGGSATACAELGRRYARGIDVRRDPKRAVELYAQACAGGVKKACKTLVDP
jgi:hypothetical protein